MAIWLDTVTQIDVANAYLNGAPGDARRHQDARPGDLTDVQAAAAKAKTDVAVA